VVISLHRDDLAGARTHLEQALALDREIGAPRKIALDLLALGRAAALAGERDAARAYYARALAVSEADRDRRRGQARAVTPTKRPPRPGSTAGKKGRFRGPGRILIQLGVVLDVPRRRSSSSSFGSSTAALRAGINTRKPP
jgi:tetratricopeptide (TPR) repeat protein